MKFKLALVTGLFIFAFAASDARADEWCSLTVNQSTYSYIWRGQFFSFGIDIAVKPPSPPWTGPNAGPLPPPLPPPQPPPPAPPFTITFHGTGIDLYGNGESYPGTFDYGHSELTGYQNPSSGAASGTYTRFAVLRYSNYPSLVYCVTNEVTVVLQ
jgi:hypothetical protein